MVKEQSITTDNTVSVSGGSDKIKAYGSFGYLNNGGVVKGQSFERYTAKANVDFTATNWLTFGNSMTVSYGKTTIWTIKCRYRHHWYSPGGVI
jgi:hypothetical protein